MAMISWASNYQNGTAPPGQTVDVNGQNMLLHWEAAAQWRALCAEFEAVWGVPLTISEAGRSLARQEYLYDGYRRGLPGFYVAAPPGSSSHGEFTAVDINSWCYGGSAGTARHNWLVANAPKYGWSWELVGKPSGEAWHFNYIFGMKTITADANGVYNITTLEEQEIMGAVQELKDAFKAEVAAAKADILNATGRGATVVYWMKPWGRTYSVSPGLIKHHADEVERNLGYQQSGQLTELAIETDEFNLIRIFRNNGLGHLTIEDIRSAPAGQVFRPDTQPTWRKK